MRARSDELLGHLAMLLLNLGLWRDMGLASFGHYCAERLGMAERTVAQRAALGRRLHALPALQRALRDGRLSYEQARLVAAEADDASVDAWIARAEATTCIALRREIEGEQETQMCARGDLDLRVPRRVASLLDAAVRAARAVETRWLPAGACLERVAVHFVETWRDSLAERSTPQRKTVERDRGLCQVPGCSRAAAHAHHVAFRSHGGGDDPANLVALCAAHHLHGVHRGFVRVTGVAPDRLRWELGVRPDGAPLQVFEPATVTVHRESVKRSADRPWTRAAGGFRRRQSLERCRDEAQEQEQVRKLRREITEEPSASSRRVAAARERAAEARLAAVEAALAELPTIEKQRAECDANRPSQAKRRGEVRVSTTDPESRARASPLDFAPPPAALRSGRTV